VIEQKVVETPVVEQVNLNVDNKSKKITEKQRKLLFVRLREAGIPEEVLKKHIEVAYGKTSTADLTNEEFDEILKEIETLKHNVNK
jgi:pimeloyl-CoA synthetase